MHLSNIGLKRFQSTSTKKLSALEKLAKRAGIDLEQVKKNSRVGRILRRNGVRGSPELERIVALPRRELRPNLGTELTELLKKPKGTMELRPVQAQALEELHDFGGLLGPIRVGAGKTLITALAGTVLEAKKPLLLVPAKLRQKTKIEFFELALHWQFQMPRILSYEMLSHADHAADLLKHAPDLIVADEVHKLKNLKAAVTRRVGRYLERTDCAFVGLSGTITKRSLRDYAHLAEWALGKQLSPLPTVWSVIEEWADCLDESVDAFKRLAPGQLERLYNDTERASEDPVRASRSAFRRRLVETPGVVTTAETTVDCALNLAPIELPDCPKVEEAFMHLLTYWETPDGWPITDAPSLARHAKELSLGFYYVWDPRPPSEWLQARRGWARACREVLKHNRRDLDSELQVVRACDLGHYPIAAEALATWRAIRDSFVPNTRAEWISNIGIHAVSDWIKKNVGIVWVEHVAFANYLSLYLKLPYYGRQGLNTDGQPIEKATGPIIASILANSEGRNLQRYNQNLVVSCQSSGARMEQLLGRTHREGQYSDEVSVDIFCGSFDQWLCLEQAQKDAKYIEDSTGQPQKLNQATIEWPTLADIENKSGFRWKIRK